MSFAPDNPPAVYHPFKIGKYEVAAGISQFGESFGNKEAEDKVFQIDREFHRYRQVKLLVRQSKYTDYINSCRSSDGVETVVVNFILDRLVRDQREAFTLRTYGAIRVLECNCTGEELLFDKYGRLWCRPSEGHPTADYRCALDALACQVQEDFVVVRRKDKRNWLAYVNVCLPSGWNPSEKVGSRFAEVHRGVPGIGPLIRAETANVNMMVSAENGLVRFVWGLQFDEKLDHHPVNSPFPDFDSVSPSGYVRVERQVIWGFPQIDAALFTIRLYLLDLTEIRRTSHLCDPLYTALESMTSEQLRYKGLADSRDALCEWLKSDSTPPVTSNSPNG